MNNEIHEKTATKTANRSRSHERNSFEETPSFDMKTFREKHCYCESKIVSALIAQSAHKEIANKI